MGLNSPFSLLVRVCLLWQNAEIEQNLLLEVLCFDDFGVGSRGDVGLLVDAF